VTQKYDLAVFIGRMVPPHLGHIQVMQQALHHAKKLVILVGSSHAPRSHRVPFTFDERKTMIYHSLPGELRDNVIILPLEDFTYNDNRWIHQVQSQVERAAWHFGYTSDPNVALIGHSKDSSSYYLKILPQYASINVENYNNLNSTDIRNVYFSDLGGEWLATEKNTVPQYVKEFLGSFIKTDSYAYILNEYDFVAKYKKSWQNVPYPVNLVCTDAVVIKAGHIIMIKRKSLPGKGMLALPGGYLNVNERAVDGMIRELREETRLKVPEPVLRGSITKHEIFDDPHRSSRGRVITIAYLIDLGNGPLDKIKGGDDAESAKWVPLDKLKREEIFEDHMDLIRCLVGI